MLRQYDDNILYAEINAGSNVNNNGRYVRRFILAANGPLYTNIIYLVYVVWDLYHIYLLRKTKTITYLLIYIYIYICRLLHVFIYSLTKTSESMIYTRIVFYSSFTGFFRYYYPQYRKTSNRVRNKSQNLNITRFVLRLSLHNPFRPGVKLIMKILQLHLSDQKILLPTKVCMMTHHIYILEVEGNIFTDCFRELFSFSKIDMSVIHSYSFRTKQ